MRYVILAGIAIAAAACSRHAAVVSTPGGSQALVTGREWTLIELRSKPIDVTGRSLTLRFDPGENRASGFSACNQFSAPYTMTADSLRFGPIVATKMACVDQSRNRLEQEFLATLALVRAYQPTDSLLDLTAEGKTLALFKNR
jgi:heat shock protein HslJ